MATNHLFVLFFFSPRMQALLLVTEREAEGENKGGENKKEEDQEERKLSTTFRLFDLFATVAADFHRATAASFFLLLFSFFSPSPAPPFFSPALLYPTLLG